MTIIIATTGQLHYDARVAGTTNIGGNVGRYVLGDLLGRGGMAEVFAGHSTGAHGFTKPVAIKRLLPMLASDHKFVQRLIGEAKVMVGVQHGNIVSVLDLARDGNDVFLVMEYVDGPSLRQLQKRCVPHGLPMGVSTYIVQAAAAGLEFAHSRPGGAVIHADVSPSNVLLTTAGEVRVADFGIARPEGSADGSIEGKFAYMPPEQARGEPLTPRSDVFALGVVLYELLTGQLPFGPDRRLGGLVPPRELNPAIPVVLEQICMKALAPDPRDRFRRMQGLIEALIDERYENRWRQGAHELAHIIRSHPPDGAKHRPETLVTREPVTIFTQSLIVNPNIELPQARHVSASKLQRMQGLMRPEALRAGAEESSSAYGASKTGSRDLRTDRRTIVPWTAWVFGVAALLGVITAFAVHSNNEDVHAAAPKIAPVTPAHDVPVPATQVPPAAPVPVPAAAETPAPAKATPAVAPFDHPPPSRAGNRRGSRHKQTAGSDAVLRIKTVNHVDAKITIENDESTIHGDVADGKFTLTPGKYHVMLSNQAKDLWVDCGKRSVAAGEHAVLVADMEEKNCWIDR